MADLETNSLLAAIAMKQKEGLVQQKIAADIANQRAADAAQKAVNSAMSVWLKRIEQQVDRGISTLSGTKARGPAVIAVLGVLFLVILAFQVGVTLTRAGVSVSALLGL